MSNAMSNLGFPTTWLHWVFKSILSGISQVIINGLAGKKITLHRGVKQGDPLSPLLFIIAMDFISRWFQKLRSNGTIRLPVANMKPCLLYADDVLFFIKPKTQQLQALKIALLAFQSFSGLAVNLTKFEIIYSRTEGVAQSLANLMGYKLGSFPFTYLGLPLSNKKLKKETFLPLIQKFHDRLTGWAAKNLSIAGRLVLLKAVLSAIPVYHMSVMSLPVWVIKEIDKIRKRFLWHGVNTEGRKMNLAKWEIVCMPKQLGGLGVVDLTSFNQALLLKWYFQWQSTEPRLWKESINQTTTQLINHTTPDTILLAQIQP